MAPAAREIHPDARRRADHQRRTQSDVQLDRLESRNGRTDITKEMVIAYDIVVRPKGSQMSTESSKLLEPNYLNGINGGISFKQYQQIKKMNEVDIAAPVAVMGYVMSNVSFEKAIKIPSTPGIYRLTETTYIQNGFKKEQQSKTVLHLAQGTKVQVPENASFISEQIDGFSTAVARNPVLIVGIDPKEEARLVGLDKSCVRRTNPVYFNSTDRLESDAANNRNSSRF